MDNEKKPTKKRINNLFDNMQYEEPDTEPRKDEEELVSRDESIAEEMLSVDAESTSVEGEAEDSGLSQVDKPGQPEVVDTDSEEELSTEDLLDDVRHSLITETAAKEEVEQSKWWRRIGRGGKRKKQEDNAKQQPEPVGVSAEPEIIETSGDVKEDEYIEQLDELIDILEDEKAEDIPEETPQVIPAEEEPALEQEPEVVDIKILKERAFHSRTLSEEEERSISEVRSVALDGGEEVFIEVEAKKEDTRQDRLKAIENALRPYRRYFTFVFIFVSVVMVLLVSASMYRLYQRSLPPPPTEEPALLPYPVGMNLPGGLKFTLAKGKIQEGRWDPRRPEWLEGTEICRWVAIPYSRQLEAVVRTLTREDQIELIMSNNDVIAYTVNSIEQLTLDELQQRNSNTPCLLLILAQSDTDARWVVTAIP